MRRWLKRNLQAVLLGGGLIVATSGFGIAYHNLYQYNNRPLTQQEANALYQEIYLKLVKASGESNRAVPLQLWTTGNEINAYAGNAGIYVTTNMVKLLGRNKDMIAMVLAHELSHVLLSHTKDGYTLLGSPQSQLELEADELGATILMRAGFNICEARKFYLTFMQMNGNNLVSSHPANIYRYFQLSMPWCESRGGV